MPTSHVAGLLGIALGIILGGIAVAILSHGYFRFMRLTFHYPLKSTLAWVLQNEGMLKRIAITVVLLICLHLASVNIHLPGIDNSALKELMERLSYSSGTKVHPGLLKEISIFSIGLAPFFVACIVLQIVSVFIPSLRALSPSGKKTRELLKRYTYGLTIIFSAIQAYMTAVRLEQLNMLGEMHIVGQPGMGFRLLAVATMTAAVVLLLFTAEIINTHGIGNGVAMIALSILYQHLQHAAQMLLSLVEHSKLQPMTALLLTAFFLITGYFVFCFSRLSKPMDFQDDQARKMRIPLRGTIVGMVPLTLATVIFFLPITIASFLDARSYYFAHLYSNPFVSIVIVEVLTFILVYLYALIVFDPTRTNDLLSRYGFAKAGKELLDKNMSGVLLGTGIVLVVFNILPKLLILSLRTPLLVADLFGASVLLVLVGIISDIIYQMEFFKKKFESDIKEWAIGYIALDETEALIKSHYLENKNIVTLIEPLRFTWGMPIRTMVDQYRIYVPAHQLKEARGLLE